MTATNEGLANYYLDLLREIWGPRQAGLTVQQTAETLRIIHPLDYPYEVVRRNIASGALIPGLKKNGGTWLVTIYQLAHALADQMLPDEPAPEKKLKLKLKSTSGAGWDSNRLRVGSAAKADGTAPSAGASKRVKPSPTLFMSEDDGRMRLVAGENPDDAFDTMWIWDPSPSVGSEDDFADEAALAEYREALGETAMFWGEVNVQLMELAAYDRAARTPGLPDRDPEAPPLGPIKERSRP